MSERQRNAGFIIPDNIEPPAGYTWLTMCIPDDPLYHAAARGALLQLTKWTAWDKTYQPGDTRAAQAAAIWTELYIKTLKIGCWDMLRQNPENACEIQIKTCGLDPDSWTTLIDIGACIDTHVQGIVDSAAESLLQKLLDQWDGSVDSIAPDLIYDGSTDDTWRDELQCIALGILVDALCEGEAERRTRGETWSNSIINAVNFFAAGALGMAGPAGWLAALALTLANGARAVITAWNAAIVIDLQNEFVRDEITCFMYDNLRGGTPTLGAFQQSLDGYTGSIAGADVIGNAVKATIQDFEVYVTYLNMLQEVHPLAKAGFLEGGCPCNQWEHEFFDGNGGEIYWSAVANASDSNALAIWDAVGEKWDAVPRIAEPNYSIGVIQTGEALQAWGVWDIEIHLELHIVPSESRAQRADGGLAVFTWPGDTPLVAQNYSTTGDRIILTENIGQTMKRLFIRWSGGRDAAYARLTYVRIRGYGVDPFTP